MKTFGSRMWYVRTAEIIRAPTLNQTDLSSFHAYYLCDVNKLFNFPKPHV